jgi:tetratricopeptide (TPR) repeat protein
MKLIEWWQQAGARTAWLSSDLRAELSGDTEVSIDALAPDLREIASALLLCQKTDYSHALERLNGHVFTDEFNGLASLLKARVYAQAGDFKNAGMELENGKNLSADARIVAEVELHLSQDLDLADDLLETRGLCECEEWQRVLGDTFSFLPRDIQSHIRDKIPTVSWLTDGCIVAMLCVVLDMKQREYPSALKLIEEAYPQSSSKGHLFLLRARVHHALDEFDEMLLCLKGAAELCDDVDMFQGVFDELSANTMARHREKQSNGIQKLETLCSSATTYPTFKNTEFLISTVNAKCLEVLMTSFRVYSPEARIRLAVSNLDHIKIAEKNGSDFCDLQITLNTASNFGEAYNDLVQQVPNEVNFIVLVNDDIVLNPNTIDLLFQDSKSVIDGIGMQSVGWLAARSNHVRGTQNIRNAFGNDRRIGIQFANEDVVVPAKVISPILSLIPRANWVDFLPINWFSDDVQCMQMSDRGLRHFVSRAYCHHVGSQTVGVDVRQNIEDAKQVITELHPEMLGRLGLG